MKQMTLEHVARSEQDRARSLRRRGALILALFALLWAAVAASGLPSEAAWPVRIAALVISAGLILVTYQPGDGDSPEPPRRQPEEWYRRVGIINLAQFVAIAIVVLASINMGTPELVPPLVCLIVGLHFFPLARLFDQPEYTSTAMGLCLAALAGLVVLAVVGAEESRVVVGSLAAVTLWATAGRLALRP